MGALAVAAKSLKIGRDMPQSHAYPSARWHSEAEGPMRLMTVCEGPKRASSAVEISVLSYGGEDRTATAFSDE